jgi:HEAT repeat protein
MHIVIGALRGFVIMCALSSWVSTAGAGIYLKNDRNSESQTTDDSKKNPLDQGAKKLGDESFTILVNGLVHPTFPYVNEEIERLKSSDCHQRLNAVYQLEDMGEQAYPTIPYLIQTLRHYSPAHQIAFDCGSGKAAPGALASIGKPAIVPLIEALSSSDWNVHTGAEEALLKMGMIAREPVLHALRNDSVPAIRGGCLAIIADSDDAQVTKILVEEMMSNTEVTVRARAAALLGERKDRSAVPALRTAALNGKEQGSVRGAALFASKKLDGQKALESTLPLLRNDHDQTFRSAISDLVDQAEDNRSLQQLAADINGNDGKALMTSLESLGKMQDDESMRILLDALKSDKAYIRIGAARSLEQRKVLPPLEPLLAALKDADFSVRASIVSLLGRSKDPKVVEPIIRALQDKDLVVRRRALDALKRIADKEAVTGITGLLYGQDQQLKSRAVVVLGELRDPQAVEALITVVHDAYSIDRRDAVQALVAIGAPAVEPLLNDLRKTGSVQYYNDAYVVVIPVGKNSVEFLLPLLSGHNKRMKEFAINTLGTIKDQRSITPLIAVLDDRTVSRDVEKALAFMGPSALRQLVALKGEHDAHVQAIRALLREREPDRRGVHQLIAALKHEKSEERSKAVVRLGAIKDKQAVASLILALEDSSSDVRIKAVESLGELSDSRVEDALIAVLRSNDELQYYAVNALGRLNSKRAVPDLIMLLSSPNLSLRSQAAAALGQMGDREAIPALIMAMTTTSENVKHSAEAALRTISGKKFLNSQDDWIKWSKRHGIEMPTTVRNIP